MKAETANKILLASRITLVTVTLGAIAANVISQVALARMEADTEWMNQRIKQDRDEPIVYTATPHRDH